MGFLIYNNYIVVILFPFFPSFPRRLSVFTSLICNSGPMCLAIPVTMTTRSLSIRLPLYLTSKLAATQLWFWRQDNFSSVLLRNTKFLTHQAADFVFGLIGWCFVSAVDVLNERDGEIVRKVLHRDSVDKLELGRNGERWDGDEPGVTYEIAQLRGGEIMLRNPRRGGFQRQSTAGRTPSVA